MRLGLARPTLFINSAEQPLWGGSTNSTFTGVRSWDRYLPASMHTKRMLCMWLHLAFCTASATARGFSSTPVPCPPAAGSTDANGASATVGVQKCGVLANICHVKGVLVQYLGGRRVYLVKALGGDGKGVSPQLVQQVTVAVQHLFPLAKHHGGVAGINVLHHRLYKGAKLYQLAHKIFAAGKNGGGGDHRYHHILGVRRHPHHHMPQQPSAAVFIIWCKVVCIYNL